MFIRLINDEPTEYLVSWLRFDNPHTSFPDNISEDMLANYDVFAVTELPRPAYDPDTHELEQSEFYQVDGHWQVHYNAQPLPEEQVAKTMRDRRNALLTDTDWLVTLSYERQEPVPQSWQIYRQELRDVTAQEGFPYQIVWPVHIPLDGER